jgi:uncharacterized protein YtpQ (UPF0354 family)
MYQHLQQSINTVMPFLVRADLKEYPDGAFVFNPLGTGRILKKIADDLACVYILTDDGTAVVADKALIKACNLSAEDLAGIAEQNVLKLFQFHQVLKNDKVSGNALYSIYLNNRNEASCMLSPLIWTTIAARYKDRILVSVPKYNEIHFCTLQSNAVPGLISHTISTYNDSGSAALSPNIYLRHNGSWVVFDKGHQQILDYCLVHGIF